MIDVQDLVVSYGTATALEHVTLTVGKGEMVALLGPNGAGKSTLANTLAGLIRPASGTVRVGGRLALIPEGRQLFPDLTVADNLALGGWRSGQRDPSPVYELLPRLAELASRRAGVLSGGEQQMVAFGRAMMSRPDALVVDELSLGLAPAVTADLAAHLAELNRTQGLTVLLIEQNARLAFELCRRAYVLESGRVVTGGDSAELAGDPRVASAYLGGAIT
ncbi:Branched-chain amino acid transport ATP-binding protein LivF (TC 3.A.1.4.1) [[Actinomadura] parvosata subsp. kistnae]|uniref:ABC transporter ATP-binding protein n=2 Tax=Nonomuraea TaxID=83681 RepID=A0A1V0A5I6_9ACTN|nr:MULTISPECIES: ABC transporter ATP-binding protein [unclassified Nonomuraea]AQZ65485.1 ABC transporter ATP-binding protein [Nonomuraea sp. ATCC 55076]NJP98225.1 ABC transporter ATP-binding protein [Nonomuraea sp. FMUSA5-5]SPL96829.1 Branched-chain amino acid transport ATP-binding protein LivF (TC 3.A.1.4.1) [Actinomadura parvosata subsp. kistnae]